MSVYAAIFSSDSILECQCLQILVLGILGQWGENGAYSSCLQLYSLSVARIILKEVGNLFLKRKKNTKDH